MSRIPDTSVPRRLGIRAVQHRCRSVPRHFGTGPEVSQDAGAEVVTMCIDTSAPVLKTTRHFGTKAVQHRWRTGVIAYYSAPLWVRRIVMNPSVCLCVSLSASISLEPLDRSSQNLVCRSPVAMARLSSGSVALLYVLLVGFERYRYWGIGYWPILAGVGWHWYRPNTFFSNRAQY